MKEEALKLAVWLENMSKLGWADNFGQELDEISAMIRRLVEELDKQGKPKAWIREDGVIAFFKQKEIDDQGFKWQPLYTAPQTKPFNEEEFNAIAYSYRSCPAHDPKGVSDRYQELLNYLERHGIK